MGLPKEDIVTLPSDPIQEKLTYAAALAACLRVGMEMGTEPTGLGCVLCVGTAHERHHRDRRGRRLRVGRVISSGR